MSSVVWRACTPWSSRLRAKARISPARWRSVSTSGAARICALSCRSDRRCSAKRSRSETMLTTRPASVTGRWRMPWRAMTSAASCRVCSVVSDCTGELMTSAMGVVSARCGSVTRPRMSCRVRMPTGACASSSTSTEPIPRSCIAASACASGVAGLQASGCLARQAGQSARPATVRRAACAGSARCDSVQEVHHAAVQEVGEGGAGRGQALHFGGRQRAGRRCRRWRCRWR